MEVEIELEKLWFEIFDKQYYPEAVEELQIRNMKIREEDKDALTSEIQHS